MPHSMGRYVGVNCVRHHGYGGVCVLVGLTIVKVGGVGEVEFYMYRLDLLA